MSSKEYVDNLQREFSKHADPLKASWEKKYMLNQFEFLGMTTPTRREITKKLIQRIGLPGNSQTESVVKMLWKMEQREFQYAAMEIAERKCGEDMKFRFN